MENILYEVLDFVKLNPAVVNLMTFSLGLYFGNKQAIGRDKRKEFNEISKTAFITLNKQIQCLKVGNCGQSVNDFLIIESYIPVLKRNRFNKYVQKYKNAQQGLSEYNPETGDVIFNQQKMSELESSAKALRDYLKPR